jgi:glutamine amidotransferase
MANERRPVVAIVDYGMGNLYSVQQACGQVGLSSTLSSSPADVLAADAVILPGIGAMPDAMTALRAAGMDEALSRIVADGKPLFGICLGMQLLMTEGTEFGRHSGLGILRGSVARFDSPRDGERSLKVPSIGWNKVVPQGNDLRRWVGTPLEGTPKGEFFYFVHSFCVVPEEAEVVAATTWYGNVEYCSAVHRGNIFGCQFHPERSGPAGLSVYGRFAASVRRIAGHR